MLKKIFALLLVSVMLCSCSGLSVKEHETWSGVNSYELTDGKQSIRYFKSSCPFPEEVLEAIADAVKIGAISWIKMNDYSYRTKVLDEECARQIILQAIQKGNKS